MKYILALLALAGCADGPAPAAPVEPATACSIRPAAINDRDLLTAETMREIRRVNRELRQHCAG